MNTGKIEKLLEHCDLQELETIQHAVNDLIAKMTANAASFNDDEGRKRRREERFGTNIMATLIRVTDVRPGERKEYSVTIQDISRSGMCLRADTNFTPSRVVEVTFAGPGGKIKHCYLEVVRLRKMADQHGSWLEVGCCSVSDQEVRRLRLLEERITKMRTKLHHKKGIQIVVVGPDTKETAELTARIKAEEYQIRQVDSLRPALEIAEKTSAHLVLFCQGSVLCQDKNLLEEFKNRPAELATLAIVDKDEDRFTLFKAGIDECLTAENRDEFLVYAIERALVGHVVRQSVNPQTHTYKVWIISSDSTRVNLMTYQLEDLGLDCKVFDGVENLPAEPLESFHMAFADFDPENIEAFKQLWPKLGKKPLIALCEEMRDGHLAMANGAANYLNMPPNREELRMILESSLANIKLPT